jgi:hypothetical protein
VVRTEDAAGGERKRQRGPREEGCQSEDGASSLLEGSVRVRVTADRLKSLGHHHATAPHHSTSTSTKATPVRHQRRRFPCPRDVVVSPFFSQSCGLTHPRIMWGGSGGSP